MFKTHTYNSMPQLLFCRTDDFHVFLCNSRMWNTRNALIRIFHTGEINKIYKFGKPRKFTFISTGTFLLPGENSFFEIRFVFGNNSPTEISKLATNILLTRQHKVHI